MMLNRYIQHSRRLFIATQYDPKILLSSSKQYYQSRLRCSSVSTQYRLFSSGVDTSGSGKVSAIYDNKVRNGDISDDPAQRVALDFLDNIYDKVIDFDKRRPALVQKFKDELRAMEKKAKEEEENSKSNWFTSMFKSKPEETKKFGDAKLDTKSYHGIHVEAPKGIYLYGGPGSGKTFTMELFHQVLPIQGKRRVHFNEFMLQVHRMLHSLQKQGYQSDVMIDRCVDALYEEGWVLCFDEFQVTDIADAMIIRRLFDALLARGMVVVITSNREPDELYKNGIQRDLFLPFIDLIKKTLQVVDVQSEVDYRMTMFDRVKRASEEHEENVYFKVGGKFGVSGAAAYERMFDNFTKNQSVYDVTLNVQGRKLIIPRAGKNEDVARFKFEQICGQAVGASDFYAIASTFHTVFIDDVPVIKLNMINQLRRFITLIDILYDQRVVLVLSAHDSMDNLFDAEGVTSESDTGRLEIQETDLLGDAKYVPSKSNLDEVFAWQRTVSRLHEMQRPDYLLQAHKRRAVAGRSPVRFLSELQHSSLDAEDIKRLWDRYDINKDGVIDESELLSMLSEITLFRSGHKHVPREVLAATKRALLPDDSKTIKWENFRSYFEKFGLDVRS